MLASDYISFTAWQWTYEIIKKRNQLKNYLLLDSTLHTVHELNDHLENIFIFSSMWRLFDSLSINSNWTNGDGLRTQSEKYLPDIRGCQQEEIYDVIYNHTACWNSSTVVIRQHTLKYFHSSSTKSYRETAWTAVTVAKKISMTVFIVRTLSLKGQKETVSSP